MSPAKAHEVVRLVEIRLVSVGRQNEAG